MRYLIFLALLCVISADNAVFTKAPPKSDNPGISTKNMVLSTERQPEVKALLSTIASPVGFVHVFPSKSDGCTGRVRLDRIAKRMVANLPLTLVLSIYLGCVGNIISNGTTFQIENDNENSLVGV